MMFYITWKIIGRDAQQQIDNTDKETVLVGRSQKCEHKQYLEAQDKQHLWLWDLMLLKIPAILGVMLCHWVGSSDVSKDYSAWKMSDTITQYHIPEDLSLQQLRLLINFLDNTWMSVDFTMKVL